MAAYDRAPRGRSEPTAAGDPARIVTGVELDGAEAQVIASQSVLLT